MSTINCAYNQSSILIGYSEVFNCQIEAQNLSEKSKFSPQNQEIKSLTISSCFMPQIIPSIVESFSNIQRLFIRSCKLTKISSESFRGLKNLKILWIDFNEIKELTENVFEHVENLEDVSFYGNKIVRIDRDIFDNLKSLKKFDLRENEKFNEIFDEKKSFGEFLDRIFRKSGGTLVEDVKAFIHNNNFNDFTLTFENIEFDVHRFLLEARSPFLGELIRNNPEVQSLSLDHQISAENIKFIIDFIYEDKMPPETANMFEIFEIASKWQLERLTIFTGLKVMDESTPEHALEIFILNDKFKVSEELKKLAFEKIQKSLPGIHLSENLLHESDKLRELMAAKKKFDEIIDKDLRKIEELTEEVEKKNKEKAIWIKRILKTSEDF